MGTLKLGFNNRHTYSILAMVEEERLRQVSLGLAGDIPHACEDPTTSWEYRLGVLLEEVGEVAKEVIEGRPHEMAILIECVQVAAVAAACAEGVMVNLSVASNPKVHSRTRPRASRPDETDAEDCQTSRHSEVLSLANAIYNKRNEKYRDMWRRYGLRGAMMQLRSAVERSWRMVWNWDVEDFDGDDLLDAINYAAIAYRCLVEHIDGEWTWGKN